MITKTIKTPAIIQLLFILALLPGLIACTFMIGKASASPIDHSICDAIYYDSYVGQVERKDYVQCVNRWTLLTNKAKRSYINNQK